MANIGMPSSQPPILGAPVPGGGLLSAASGIDPAMAQLLAPFLDQMMGGKFIPQQFPAQGLMDQMMSAKWQTSMRANLAQAQKTDQATMYQAMSAFRARNSNRSMTPLQQAQLNTFAGMATSPYFMGPMEALLGAQTAEDTFFGRRGSATRLATAANRIGFYRSDAVTGKDRMSDESLSAFSSQVYSNLYGPGADLNDVSGFSAGRVGDLMTDLAQRGVLPASMSKLSTSERRRAFRDVGGAGMQLSESVVADQAIKSAMARGDSIDDIQKISGGADAVRKIDATRVSNTLKDYTKALGSIRQIFGDNGVSNAPMQQLLGAMEALTQNSMSSMSPGKIENLMRRTQMASRDSGVSLEALMGLSARSGALADQYGLTREIGANNVVTAMEHGRAMRDTGMFNPAFGRMDPNKAMLTVLDQSMRADASPTGRYLAVAGRLAAEKRLNANGNMAKMVAAMQRGETSYYDTTENRTVNFYDEFGRNPDKIMRRYLKEEGVSVDTFGAMFRNFNDTQEFQTAGAARNVQAADLKSKLQRHLSVQTGIRDLIGGGLNDAQKTALTGQIGAGLSTALIDTVNNTMKPEERLSVLRGAFRQSAMDYARSQLGPNAPIADVIAMADTISKAGANNIMGFKKDSDITDFLSVRQANAGEFVFNKYGLGIEALRQTHSSNTRAEANARSRRNLGLAGMPINDFADGSNFYQRLSDAIGGRGGSGTMLDQILGIVDSGDMRKKLLENVTGGDAGLTAAFADIKDHYAAGLIDTDAEKTAFVNSVTNKNFARAKKLFDGTAAEKELSGKTRYMQTSEVAAALTATMTTDNVGHIKQIYIQKTGATPEQANAIFADPAKRQKAMEELAGISGIEGAFAERGINTGIGADVMTQATFAELNKNTHGYASADPAAQARTRALGKLFSELDHGEARGESLLAAFGVTGKADAEKALDAVISGSGGIDAAIAEMQKAGIAPEQIQKIASTTEFSRNVNAIGGFKVAGGGQSAAQIATYAARKTAFEKAVRENRVTGRMAQLAAQDPKKLSDNEKKELDAFYNASEEQFDAELKTTSATDSTRKQILTESKDLAAQAAKNSDPTGIGASIASAIGTTVTDAFKSAVSELAKVSGFGKELTLSGNLTFTGLEAAVANLVGKPSVDPTESGATTSG